MKTSRTLFTQWRRNEGKRSSGATGGFSAPWHNKQCSEFANATFAATAKKTLASRNRDTAMNAKNKTKRSDAGCGSRCVCLQLTRPDAQQICIAGSFNDWHPNVTLMIRLNDGKWAKELALPPGRYEYRFVVDGEWVDDPAATELIPNVFGTANAVLVVAASKPPVAARPASVSPSMRQQASSSQSATRVSRAAPEPTPHMTGPPTLAAILFRRAALA